MMISPDSYYEINLKGKTEKEIRSAISGLKNEIEHLKNTIEHPGYGSKPLVHPSEEVRTWCTRLYLERAKQALLEMGAVYVPSQAELEAQQFQENIDNIKKIRFKIDVCFDGYTFYTITIDDEHIHYDVEHSLMLKPSNLPDMTDYPMSKSEFLDGLRALYIGEWRHNYDPARFGYIILDGTQWSLDIEYHDGVKPARYYGSNSYPYNFHKLKELFGIDDMDFGIDEE